MGMDITLYDRIKKFFPDYNDGSYDSVVRMTTKILCRRIVDDEPLDSELVSLIHDIYNSKEYHCQSKHTKIVVKQKIRIESRNIIKIWSFIEDLKSAAKEIDEGLKSYADVINGLPEDKRFFYALAFDFWDDSYGSAPFSVYLGLEQEMRDALYVYKIYAKDEALGELTIKKLAQTVLDQ